MTHHSEDERNARVEEIVKFLKINEEHPSIEYGVYFDDDMMTYNDQIQFWHFNPEDHEYLKSTLSTVPNIGKIEEVEGYRKYVVNMWNDELVCPVCGGSVGYVLYEVKLIRSVIIDSRNGEKDLNEDDETEHVFRGIFCNNDHDVSDTFTENPNYDEKGDLRYIIRK